MAWESRTFVERVQHILDALEVPQVDVKVRRYFQRTLYLPDMFGGGGCEKIILLIRTILESEGNGDAALIEPIVRAVSFSMRPEWTDLGLAWIAAFDEIKLTELLQTMRGLDLFAEKNLGYYLGISVSNKLRSILDPLVPKPAPLVRAKRKPTKRAKRCPAAAGADCGIAKRRLGAISL
jgi:hypothetical protein